MFIDFKCTNEKCEKFEESVTISLSYEDIDKQRCESCSEPLKRIWTASSISIKTSDGFKSWGGYLSWWVKINLIYSIIHHKKLLKEMYEN